MSSLKKTLIAVVGPNASGKTSLAIKLAKKYNGEIISADSRQVYRGLNIGTGKATKKEQRQVRHHLLDVVPPNREFNVSHYKKFAPTAINKIQNKNKIPFLVGGTGFWIQAIIDDADFPPVRPNKKLRQKLGRMPIKNLYALLKKIDPIRAANIDRNNPYRLIRAIEIVRATKRPIPALIKKSPFNSLILGIKQPKKILYQRIDLRLKKRFRQGMINEVKKLIAQGISGQRLYDLGLEYRYISLYLKKKLTRQEMEIQLKHAIHHYAKRQLTWFKRDRRIHWIKNQKQANKLIKKFLIID